MAFEQDDLVDYANEEYDDEMTAEDEEQLALLVPRVKSQLSDYTGYTYDDVMNELWDCYMDVDQTVINMKSEYHPLTVVSPVTNQKNSRKRLRKVSIRCVLCPLLLY